MTAGDWLAVGWAGCGLVLGLVAANWVYSDRSDQDRGLIAACAFMFSVVAFPMIAGIGLAWLLFVAGAWLLPAYRRERREKREETRRTEAETARVEIDKLHAQVGLPPVDWLADAGAVRAADGPAGAGEGAGMGALPGPGVVRRYGGER